MNFQEALFISKKLEKYTNNVLIIYDETVMDGWELVVEDKKSIKIVSCGQDEEWTLFEKGKNISLDFIMDIKVLQAVPWY